MASLFIGISLGLIGGGGSILTIPVLVYLFAVSPTLAISYSLFIVGFTSLIGAFNNYRKGLVNYKTALLFGSSSIVTVFITRRFIIPIVPDVFFEIGTFQVTHSLFVMVVFALLMLAASVSMIRNQIQKRNEKLPFAKKPNLMIVFGVLIGLVTGFIGAGGGFLLIPALVLLMKLPMKQAIGTSLLIISLNSMIGFAGDLGRHTMDWKFIIIITVIASIGVLLGNAINKRIDGSRLKKGFGWFILVMAIFIIVKEIFFN